jgi:tetratricopeptide (TPR) repeat protein
MIFLSAEFLPVSGFKIKVLGYNDCQESGVLETPLRIPQNRRESVGNVPLPSRQFSDGVMIREIKNRKLCFCGKLAGMSRKDAETLARNNGAVVAAVPRGDVDLIVIGEGIPLGKTWVELNESFDEALRRSFESGRLETITETTFWQWLGIGPLTDARALYTPTALAELIGVSAAAIRLWHRQGFLKSDCQVGKLPYFAFQEIPVAKRLKVLTESGYSLRQIAKAIESFQKEFPQTDRVLLNLFPTSDPRKILYDDGESRCDSKGQTFFDFEPTDEEELLIEAEESMPELRKAFTPLPDEEPRPLPLFPETRCLSEEDRRRQEQAVSRKVIALCQTAWQQEEAGEPFAAIESCRAALLLGGPDTDISFQLAELLAQTGSLEAAKERYYLVLEADGRHLEALNGLARVLDRLGQEEDAAELYRTALVIHPGYAEVRYHLGELLFRLGDHAEAEEQLLLFKSADPDSLMGENADLILRQIRGDRSRR